MAEPCPSTMALVASVVESETSAMSAPETPWPLLPASEPAASSTLSSASVTPMERSPFVVSAFALASTVRAPASMSAASV